MKVLDFRRHKNNKDKIKYFVYVRKSTESDERQVQSIDDQISRLNEIAHNLNLDVIEVFTESKSAKEPNNRPIFEDMMQRIENGEANGILCWKLDRLFRNPVDSGRISYLLQKGTIKSIQTIDRQYLPEDNVLLFSVESGMANQYIRDLSTNTKRGLRSKLEKGWLPNLVPIGYLNDKEKKIIVKDPERFNLIRKMWDLMLTGNYTPPKILDIANNEWGFRTRRLKKIGDKPLSRSGIYRIFTNLFYAGINEVNGVQYEGKHKKMITLEEYDRVQFLLGRKGKPRPKKHQFAFTGFIRCGECGCLYTAQTKQKFIKSTGEIRNYTYYHCTRKKRDIKCSQKKSLREDKLERQIKEELEKYTILPEFLDWALAVLNEKNDSEIEDRAKTYEMQHKALVKCQNELGELTKIRYRQLIDDDEFTRQRRALQNQINRIKDSLRETEKRAERWLELTEKTFHFATYARKAFLTGGLELKKEILMSLGKNIIIADERLYIEPYEWLEPIKNDYAPLEKEYLRLEPTKTPGNKANKEVISSVRSRWLRR